MQCKARQRGKNALQSAMQKSTHRGVRDRVSCVVDSDPPRRECLSKGVRNDIGGEFDPLLHLVHEWDGKVVVQRQSGWRGRSGCDTVISL
jgi:hypothetical protein